MGRVNSLKRLRYADAIGCDSADGTYLTYGPGHRTCPRLLAWLRQVNDQARTVEGSMTPCQRWNPGGTHSWRRPGRAASTPPGTASSP